MNREDLRKVLEVVRVYSYARDSCGAVDPVAVSRIAEAITLLQAELAKAEPEPVTYGVDWGKHGDRTCVSIVKLCAGQIIEVIATEYEPLYTKESL